MKSLLTLLIAIAITVCFSYLTGTNTYYSYVLYDTSNNTYTVVPHSLSYVWEDETVSFDGSNTLRPAKEAKYEVFSKQAHLDDKVSWFMPFLFLLMCCFWIYTILSLA